MSEETISREQVDAKVQEIFKNKTLGSQIADLLVRKKPVTYGNRAVAPYYNKEIALQIKPVIDAIIADKQPRMFSFASYGTLKPRTLYSKINQAMHYLCDMMDNTDDYYKTACSHIEVKSKQKGIVLSWRVEDPLVAIPVTTILQVEDWEQKLEKWVEESPEGSVYHKQGLALTESKVQELRASFASLTNILWKITPFEIKIIKHKPPQ